MKNIFLLIFLSMSVVFTLSSQSKKAYIKAADNAVIELNPHGALVYYDKALSFDQNDQDILFKTAEAARIYNAYGFAASKYQYLLDTLKSEAYPQAHFRLGEMYQKLGMYEDAAKYYTLYLSEYSNNDQAMTAAARSNLSASNKARELIKTPDNNISVIRMGDDVNTSEADFAASNMGNKMFFSRLGYESKAKRLKNKQISKSLQKINQDESSVLIPGMLNEGDRSVANLAINSKANKVFYSVCDYVFGYSQRCDLYCSDIDKDGNFSNEIKLPASINDMTSSNTQPSIGMNKASGKETLFFVSDRVGGLGGRDIWFSNIENGNFSTPVNLKTVNSSSDEISPFYHTASQTLYFSTEGREGFGGFDVFKMEDGTQKPILMPSPINTSMNDMFFYLDPSGYRGYLTSNRTGSNLIFDSYEACCMDIYSVNIKEDIILNVETLLKSDNTKLNGTNICLQDADTGEMLNCITNPEDINNQSFKVKPNRNYKITATKNGYTTHSQTFMTFSSDKVLNKTLLLDRPKLKLEVYTFEAPTNAALIGTTITLVNLSNNTTKQIVISNEKANDYSFEIYADQEYKVIASKDGFTTASTTFDTKGLKGLLRKDLFLDRNNIIVPSTELSFPIVLYFDNDYPNPRSRTIKTTSSYINLANNYTMKENEYIQNFTKNMAETDQQTVTSDYNNFFANDVRNGAEKLNQFMGQLEQMLSSGQKLEIEVSGFASPRAKSSYNKLLSKRRIHSIKNELELFNNGILKQFIKSGKLKIKEVPYGSARAKGNVSYNMKDRRNSIYNLNAARERRVEILKVNIK